MWSQSSAVQSTQVMAWKQIFIRRNSQCRMNKDSWVLAGQVVLFRPFLFTLLQRWHLFTYWGLVHHFIQEKEERGQIGVAGGVIMITVQCCSEVILMVGPFR